MFYPVKIARRTLGPLTLLAAIWLVACDTVPIGGGGGGGGPSINTRNAVSVALLVPGGSADAGDDLLARNFENAARMAIADLGDVQIDLMVYNTASNPGQAAAVAQQAVADGAKIIIGPLRAEESNAVGLAVASAGINVLSFSNNADIAGGNVFVLGNTFPNIADRLVSYGASQGKRRLAIVYDQNAQGEAGKAAVEAAATRYGANVVATGTYQFSQDSIISSVPGIASSIRGASVDAVILTADTVGALPLLTQLLTENQVDPATTTFMGLTRWDVPAGTVELPGVQGGIFTLPDPVLAQQFGDRYAAAYGEPPHPLAGLAYDGIAAIGALINAGKSDALAVSGLTQGSGFAGVNGIFRLRSDGTSERGLAVAQIINRQVTVIDPAPRAFGGAGL